MTTKFTDYTVEDLTIVEELETDEIEEKIERKNAYQDYTEKDLVEQRPILDDLIEFLKDRNWQVIARTPFSLVILENRDMIEDLCDLKIYEVKSEYLFEVMDRKSRVSAEVLSSKVGKVRNSSNYFWLAEEIEIKELELKGIR